MNNFRRDKINSKFTGWHMLVIFVSFFGIVICVNFSMAIIAQRSWTGLVVKNPYVASQHFNSDLAEARRQNQRGWVSELSYKPGKILLSLRDQQDQPIFISDLTLKYGRPTYEMADHTVNFTHLGYGVYSATVPLQPGVWQLNISGGSNETSYRRNSRIYISQTGEKIREE